MFYLDKSGRCYVPISYETLSIGLLEVDVIFSLPGVRRSVDDIVGSHTKTYSCKILAFHVLENFK